RQRSRPLRYRCGGRARSARQPAVAIRYVARVRGAASGRGAGAAALRGHGRREHVGPRRGRRHRRGLSAPRGDDMRAWGAVVLLLAGCTPGAEHAVVTEAGADDRAVIELVYATPYSPTHPFSRADQRWIEFVETQ